jgi:hypothetical protein
MKMIRTCLTVLLVAVASLALGHTDEQAVRPASESTDIRAVVIGLSGALLITPPTKEVQIVKRNERPIVKFGSHVFVQKGSTEIRVGDDIRITMIRNQEILISRDPNDNTIFIAAAVRLPGSIKVALGAMTIALHAGSTVKLSLLPSGGNRVKSFQGKVTRGGPDGPDMMLTAARRPIETGKIGLNH